MLHEHGDGIVTLHINSRQITATATLGKTAGKDEAADKPTYVSLLGLEAARAYADELRADALDALSIFGERAARLTQLADFICHRQF